MNKRDLRDLLVKEGIAEDSFSLDGGLPNEAYCLEKVLFFWTTYYSERGEKNGLRWHLTEESACEFLYQEIKSG